MVLIENVPNMKNSDAGKMLKARMKRLGYKVVDEVLDGRDFGGLTSRVRYYLVGTLLDVNFEMPKPIERNSKPIWDKFIEPYILNGEARLVNHSLSFKKGLESGRLRVIKRDSLFSGTILKSQDRMAKDSIVIMDEKRNGNMYFPSVEQLAKLMQIPDNYNLFTSSKAISTEFIGQSIEFPMHDAIVQQIRESLLNCHARLNSRLF
jgi:DNA (cytosine-5)-methyltransferase 1